MLLKIKLVVPLSIPATLDTWFAPRSLESIFTIGVPAHTADSNRSLVLFFIAASISSWPCSKITALFAVITCLPALRAIKISSRAVSTPPISSTRTSISSSVTAKISLTIFTWPGLHLGLSLRAPIQINSHSEYNSLPLVSCSYKPVATLPHPHIPIFNLAIINLVSLAVPWEVNSLEEDLQRMK